MWQTYGKHDNEEAAGACLIFNNKQCFAKIMQHEYGRMSEHSKIPQEDLNLYKIHYLWKPDAELEKILERLTDQLEHTDKFIKGVRVEKVKSALEQAYLPIKIRNALRQFVCELLDSIRFLFKERYYRHEKERRVILLRYGERDKSLESQIKPDTDSIPPRFYMEAPENLRFNEVILGPNAKHVQQWKRWFEAQNENIEIYQSKIPYGES